MKSLNLAVYLSSSVETHHLIIGDTLSFLFHLNIMLFELVSLTFEIVERTLTDESALSKTGTAENY